MTCRKKRRLQFSLRVLIIGVVLLAIFFAWIAASIRTYQDKYSVAQQLEALGATVEETRPVPSWIRWLVGNDGYAEIVSVAFYDDYVSEDALLLLRKKTKIETLLLNKTRMGDERMADIGKLVYLRNLYLVRTAITDAGVAKLTGLTNLEVLDLSETSITDQALSQLSNFPHLRVIAVDKTAITDNGLLQLGDLPSLKVAYIEDTNVTKKGIADLKTSRPAIQAIERSSDRVWFEDGSSD